MPRDGSNVYTQPFPNVVDGTTIESAVYNGFTNDVTLDLNTPRPVVAGGTGASSADAALVNLGAEKAGQVVTNYGSHTFVAGSFSSAPGATTAPSGSAYFSGVCHILDTNHITLEARRYDGGTTGPSWTRQKVGGTWGAWVQNAGTQTEADTRYVNVTGDTMSGDLTVNGAVATGAIMASTASNAPQLRLVDNTGGQSKYLRCSTANSLDFINSAGTTVIASMGNTGDFLSVRAVAAGYGYQTRPGTAGPFGTNWYNLNYTGPVALWIDASNIGNITVTSDYRTKKDVTALPDMWETVKALRPIRYTQADFSPPSHVKFTEERAAKGEDVNPAPLFAADDIERWGFIAHELQETLTPSASTGEKDSPDTVQSPNWPVVVAALTKALQEAMARIEALEAS